MTRNQRYVLVAHCVMNQNTVIIGWERAAGPFARLVKDLMDLDISIVQLPCPEITFLGYERPPLNYEDYDTEAYRAHARALLYPTLLQLEKMPAPPLCLIGIAESPSCDSTTFQGVFMQELLKVLDGVRSIDIPAQYDEAEDWPGWQQFLQEIKGM